MLFFVKIFFIGILKPVLRLVNTDIDSLYKSQFTKCKIDFSSFIDGSNKKYLLIHIFLVCPIIYYTALTKSKNYIRFNTTLDDIAK